MKHLIHCAPRGLLLPFALLLCFALPSAARASCQECPFPLAHVPGDWRSADGSYTLVIREMSRDMARWGAAVWLIDAKGDVIATGTALSAHKSTRMEVQLTTKEGHRKRLILQADLRDRDHLVMRTVIGERLASCSSAGSCDRFTKVRPVVKSGAGETCAR